MIFFTGDANETQVRGHVMPTGRVIGVLERRWRDYVASFAQEEVCLIIIIMWCSYMSLFQYRKFER